MYSQNILITVSSYYRSNAKLWKEWFLSKYRIVGSTNRRTIVLSDQRIVGLWSGRRITATAPWTWTSVEEFIYMIYFSDERNVNLLLHICLNLHNMKFYTPRKIGHINGTLQLINTTVITGTIFYYNYKSLLQCVEWRQMSYFWNSKYITKVMIVLASICFWLTSHINYCIYHILYHDNGLFGLEIWN